MIPFKEMDKLKKLITQAIKVFQYYVDRLWYLPVLSTLAFLDNFLVVIPTDGILISSSILKPSRWFYFGVFIAVGSVLGAVTLAHIVDIYGIQIVEKLFPNIQSSSSWLRTQKFFDEYGLWLLFAVSITPFTQQPAIILAVLAGISLYQIALVAFTGRLLKFLLMAYVGSHAPHLLKKMWGLQDELKGVGLK